MLRSRPSSVFLGRPISLYRSNHSDGGSSSRGGAELEFLILKKGTGTAELCALRKGDTVDLLGPLGNAFPEPETAVFPSEHRGIAIIGGGIGVAPVAGFAAALPPESYDFFACFRSDAYGLERLKPRSLHVTTEDGSAGVKGMLSEVFNENTLRTGGYGLVYACGPEGMLKYVQRLCLSEGERSAAPPVTCFLSLEQRMACGVGACLGCSVQTLSGPRRCCADGPVFPAGEVLFT
jgi:dihydroorotate dehydrogenase (NAD+) catalytic subunit